MWIRSQAKRTIVNSNNVNVIFVSTKEPVIKARIVSINSDEQEYIELGTYQDKETCLKVIDMVSIVIGTNMPVMEMPLKDDVDTWIGEISKLAEIYVYDSVKGRN